MYQISIHAAPIFAGVFGALLLQIWSVFAQICSRAGILAEKNSVWRTFEKFKLLQERDGPNALFVQLWTFSPEDGQNLKKKKKKFQEKL